MSEDATPGGALEQSLWEREEDNNGHAPRYCPHCGEQLAHPDDMKENEDIEGRPGYFKAYRCHRQAHYDWGTDPATVFYGGDPYLADYYDDVPGKGSQPKDEIVAKTFDVTISYEAKMHARVVATDKHQAKDRAKDLRGAGKDLAGDIPKARVSIELHDEAREVKELTRREVENSEDVDEEEDDGVNYADRLPGWPW